MSSQPSTSPAVSPVQPLVELKGADGEVMGYASKAAPYDRDSFTQNMNRRPSEEADGKKAGFARESLINPSRQ
jgi:hypothetical protein